MHGLQELLGPSSSLVTLLLKAALLWAAALGACLLARRASAAARSRLLVCAAAAVLLLPLAELVAPSWSVELDGPAWFAGAAVVEESSEIVALGPDAQPLAGPFAQPRPAALAIPVNVAQAPARADSTWRAALPAALFTIWLAGVAFVLAPLLRGLVALGGLRRRAAPFDSPRWSAQLARIAAVDPAARRLRLLLDDSLRVPMVWGPLVGSAGSPFLVLPSEAASWDVDRVRSTLLHELAHLERRDGTARVVARLALALSWPIPFAWSAWRRLSAECERACDDRVLAAGEAPSSYAGHLLAVAEGIAEREPSPLAPAMVHGEGLEARIRALLASDCNRNQTSPMFKLTSTALLFAALLPLASFGGLSQDSTSPVEGAGDGSGVVLDVARESGREASATDAALERGLERLLARQDEETGAWLGALGYKLNNGYQSLSGEVPHVGVTALALRALLESGARPGEGPRGRALKRGTQFLLDAMAHDPGFIQSHGSRMKSHGLALEFLSALCAATNDRTLREWTQPAVDFTVKTRIKRGWRYRPFSEDNDLLNTSAQVLALQAARDAGLRVPQATLESAEAFVLEHRVLEEQPRSGDSRVGQFRYQSLDHARCTPATTASGLAVLAGTGLLEEDSVDGVLRELVDSLAPLRETRPAHYLSWHAQRLTLEAVRAWATSDARRELYAEVRSDLHGSLLKTQNADGSWDCAVGPGVSYSTAVACLLLQG